MHSTISYRFSNHIVCVHIEWKMIFTKFRASHSRTNVEFFMKWFQRYLSYLVAFKWMKWKPMPRIFSLCVFHIHARTFWHAFKPDLTPEKNEYDSVYSFSLALYLSLARSRFFIFASSTAENHPNQTKQHKTNEIKCVLDTSRNNVNTHTDRHTHNVMLRRYYTELKQSDR